MGDRLLDTTADPNPVRQRHRVHVPFSRGRGLTDGWGRGLGLGTVDTFGVVGVPPFRALGAAHAAGGARLRSMFPVGVGDAAPGEAPATAVAGGARIPVP